MRLPAPALAESRNLVYNRPVQSGSIRTTPATPPSRLHGRGAGRVHSPPFVTGGSLSRKLPDACFARVPLPFAALLVVAAAILAAGCGEVTPSGIVRGEQLFENCYPCHGRNGAGSSFLSAPAIAGLPRWYIERQLLNFRSSMRGANPQDTEGARMRPM